MRRPILPSGVFLTICPLSANFTQIPPPSIHPSINQSPMPPSLQLTTWNPTPANASSIPGGPVDYASKHWSGLISDYYGARATLVLQQAQADATAKQVCACERAV
jgi:hypothetical protein